MKVMWKPRASQLMTSDQFCWVAFLLVSKLNIDLFFFFFCLNRSKGWCSSGLQWIRWEMWKKTPGIRRSLSKGRTVLLAVWTFVMLMPGSCHKRRTAQVGGQDTQALREQGKTEFGIQKGKAKNTGAVEKWRKLSKNFFPQSSLLMLIINKGTSSI